MGGHPYYWGSDSSSRSVCCLSQRAWRFRISLFWFRIRASLVSRSSSRVWQRFWRASFCFWRFWIISCSIVGCGISITSVLMRWLYRKAWKKANPGKKRNRQDAEWISCKEKEKETSGKRKKDKREYSAMKKEDKRGRLDRDVDKKISREIFVQNEKINFGDIHKNIHLLAWVWTVTDDLI